MSQGSYKLLRQATTLAESLGTLLPDALVEPEEIAAFYRNALNENRGKDIVEGMAYGMVSVAQTSNKPYKCFLMGRSGVGKSTELTRLLQREEIKAQFQPIRFSLKDSLDPVSFKPYDVLMLMVSLLMEHLWKVTGTTPELKFIQPILDWYEPPKVTHSEEETYARELGGGLEVPKKLREWLGIFGVIKGEIKFFSTEKRDKESYRLSRQDTLLRFVNALLDECNRVLETKTGQKWLFVAEELDKQGINPELPVELLVQYGTLWEELECHLIFNIPRDLYYSERGTGLPNFEREPQTVPETPVYTPEHTLNTETIKAIEEVLEARMSRDLFEPDVHKRLIVASGGDLRMLFRMVTEAVTLAGPRGIGSRITAEDAEKAILGAKRRFYGMVGESKDGDKTLTTEEKLTKLVTVYKGEQVARMEGPVLHSLLRVGAVQEFNGRGWLGVHPMVVDILNEQKLLSSQNTPAPGGTAL